MTLNFFTFDGKYKQSGHPILWRCTMEGPSQVTALMTVLPTGSLLPLHFSTEQVAMPLSGQAWGVSGLLHLQLRSIPHLTNGYFLLS